MNKRVLPVVILGALGVVLTGCGGQSSPVDEAESAPIGGDVGDAGAEQTEIAADDGDYSGEYRDPDAGYNTGTVTFTVTEGVITDFRADPVALCSNPSAPNGLETRSVDVAIDEIDVAADGSFEYTHTETLEAVHDKQTFHVEGRIDEGRVRDGVIELSQQCEATANFTAQKG